MTDVVRIVEQVIDPAPQFPGIDVEIAAIRRVVTRCGLWSESASLAELVTGLIGAEAELDRATRIEERYRRRFGQNQDIPLRLSLRCAVASDLADQRREVTRLLLGPSVGCA